ncbi:hypothetical protein F4780DRAFT_153557 [Xylariomycetidae sp. FL0641]|nr:hypothetical protein F4780DRAFT_153557 [Xylariomycetidae sp. FL0641]
MVEIRKATGGAMEEAKAMLPSSVIIPCFLAILASFQPASNQRPSTDQFTKTRRTPSSRQVLFSCPRSVKRRQLPLPGSGGSDFAKHAPWGTGVLCRRLRGFVNNPAPSKIISCSRPLSLTLRKQSAEREMSTPYAGRAKASVDNPTTLRRKNATRREGLIKLRRSLTLRIK